MKKRQYIILGSIVALILVTKLITMQFNKIAESKKKQKSHSEYKIETKVFKVKNTAYPAKVNFTGRVKSIDRIDLYAEVSGVMKNTNPKFKEGNSFRKGQVLVRLDATEKRLQLIANRAKFIHTITKLIPDLRVDYPRDAPLWENYLASIDPTKRLPSLPKVSTKKLTYFISGRNINNTYYEIKSQETKVAKFTIYAPFNGIVKSANITAGTLVRVGQSLGQFIAISGYELEASISFKNLKFIALGQEVDLYSSDLDKKWAGKIYRIGKVINESTQTINIYIKIKGEELKEGMYLKGGVEGKMITNAFSVPRLLLLPDDKLYAVKDSVLITLPVDVIKINSDQVILKGLKDGTVLIEKPLTRAVVGTKIEVVK